jgi:hypothetical protein
MEAAWNRHFDMALSTLKSFGRDALWAIGNMTASIIHAGRRTVGVVRQRDDRRALVFYATDPDFSTLDGSSFANRHAVQRAVERIARLSRGSETPDNVQGYSYVKASP